MDDHGHLNIEADNKLQMFCLLRLFLMCHCATVCLIFRDKHFILLQQKCIIGISIHKNFESNRNTPLINPFIRQRKKQCSVVKHKNIVVTHNEDSAKLVLKLQNSRITSISTHISAINKHSLDNINDTALFAYLDAAFQIRRNLFQILAYARHL